MPLAPAFVTAAAMTSNVHARYRRAFAQALADATGQSFELVAAFVKDAEPQHGDLSFPTFPLAKQLKKAPPAIAADLAARLHVPGIEVTAVGPYVNARFATLPFTAEVIAAVRGDGEGFVASEVGRGKSVVIDYSSPNIAKPIAFHHIRSTVIGNALSRLYKSQGYSVHGINYLGDWGKQFGLVAVGLEAFGEAGRKHDMAHLVEVYIKANARAEAEPDFDERARAFFLRMEQGDAAALALWRDLREVSLREFQQIYDRLGVSFEHFEGESLYQGKMDAVIDEIRRTVGVEESEGALIVAMPYADNEPPVLLKKSDGSTLYATRDLAAAIDRHDRFNADRLLYVVATDQALHFKQVFTVLGRMGKSWAASATHVNFGRVHGMSTRKGTVVLLADVLDEAKGRALEKVRENQKAGRIETADVEGLAEQIGLGAVLFGDLKNRRTSDYTFDWDEVLSFEGFTGPYLQYAHARACKILAKAGVPVDACAAELLVLPEEQQVVRAISKLPDTVAFALEQNEPSLVARQLLDIAAAFSRWYTLGNRDRDQRVLVEGNAPLQQARLGLVDATRVALAAGMHLLGVPTPRAM